MATAGGAAGGLQEVRENLGGVNDNQDNNGLGTPLLVGENLGGENNHQGKKLLPLDEQCLCGFLSKVADGAVMGLVTLNIFFATYLLAWGRAGTRCIPGPTTTIDSSGKSVTITYLGWVQVVVGFLPFLVLPVTVFTSGLVKASEKGRRGLGLVAGLVLLEVVFGFMMGGTMMFCATDYYHWSVPLVLTVVLCILATVVWGVSFHEPKWLHFARQPAPQANVNAQSAVAQANANAQAAVAQANANAQAAVAQANQANANAQAALAQANATQAALAQANATQAAALAQANAIALAQANAIGQALAQVNANAQALAISIAQAVAQANANPVIVPPANANVQEIEAAANNA